jgi:hypothetical protein
MPTTRASSMFKFAIVAFEGVLNFSGETGRVYF